MNAAQRLVQFLEANGVDTLFGYPGGAILPFYDALYGSSIRHILVRHEQAAALAADAYARANNKVGVCVATSGPGATNLVTGIANAYLDSVPMVAITGQVPSAVIGTDAFQEVDTVGITLPIVKHSYRVMDPNELIPVMAEAFHLARSGRPGPVLVDIPKDVLNAEAQSFAPSQKTVAPARAEMDPHSVGKALDLLHSAKRPLIYAGGGIVLAEAVDAFRRFVNLTGCPTVTTLKALGTLPGDHPLFLGMLGMHGLKPANLAVQNCDLLVSVGARFDDRVTGLLEQFAPNAKVIHLDVDPAEVGKLRQPDAPVIGDLKDSLAALLETTRPLKIHAWLDQCESWKVENAWNYEAPTELIYAPKFLRDLSLAAQKETYVSCDVGQHQMWVAQHYAFQEPENHLTSGGLGTMGYGLPAAIGAQIAKPEANVINVTGDGSIMMNIQELATIKRYNLPIKIVVMDNQCLGMVRQWQELFLERRYSETDLWDNPDFVQVANAFGIPAIQVHRADQMADAIQRLHEEPGPLLVHLILDKEANVWPFVPPGKSNSVMLEGNNDSNPTQIAAH